MRVEVHLLHQSNPVEIHDVRNTYTKGPLYCALDYDGVVSKFPVGHIFRVKEYSNE